MGSKQLVLNVGGLGLEERVGGSLCHQQTGRWLEGFEAVQEKGFLFSVCEY